MFHNLYKTGYVLSKLCFFSRSPEDLPYSYSILGLMVSITLASKLYIFSHVPKLNLAAVEAIQLSLSYLLLFSLALYFILKHQKKANRWAKVLMGLFGGQLLLLLIFFPLMKLPLPESFQMILAMTHNIWGLAVGGYILHKALGIRVLNGALLVFTIELLANIPLSLRLVDIVELANK